MSGWIKLHREIQNHWLYKDKRKFSRFEAWIDILMNVNFEDKKSLIKGKLYDIKRGDSILSSESWGKRWGWDRSTVRRFFKLLQEDGMITLKSDNTTTHLSVCNYDSYQGKEPANDHRKTTKRPSNDHRTTTPKEGEESKEEKKIPNLEDFMNYVLEVPDFAPHFENLKYSLQSKYEQWLADGWKDGHGNDIKNWKTKLRNTLPYLSKQPKQQNIISDFVYKDESNMSDEELWAYAKEKIEHRKKEIAIYG